MVDDRELIDAVEAADPTVELGMDEAYIGPPAEELAEVAARIPVDPPRVMRVSCSQFASCRWRGRRLVTHLGVQPKPCPVCGKAVSA